MAITLHPDARERVSIVLASDPVVADANDAEALQEYSSTGDQSLITVPAEASIVEISPLTASSRAKAFNIMVNLGAESSEDEQMDANIRLRMLNLECGLKSISDFPDVKPLLVGGEERYPRSTIDRLGGPFVWDIAQHIARISELPTEGKESSSAPSGSATSASPAAPGTASNAKPSPTGSDSEATAAAPSSQDSAEASSATGG